MRLTFNKNISYGIEIEYVGLTVQTVKNILKNNNFLAWNVEDDATLIGEPNKASSGEVISPILINNQNNIDELKKVCELIKQKGAIENCSCGGHIHFGNHVFNNDLTWIKNFIILLLYYEDVLTRFSSGHYTTTRKIVYESAAPFVSSITKENMTFLEDTYEKNPNKLAGFFKNKYVTNAFNLTSLEKRIPDQTIEIRIPNGTVDSHIWLMNINTFGNLISYSLHLPIIKQIELFAALKKRLIFNSDGYCLNQIDYDYHKKNLKDLDKAKELADTIFFTDKEKQTFLNQYENKDRELKEIVKKKQIKNPNSKRS